MKTIIVVVLFAILFLSQQVNGQEVLEVSRENATIIAIGSGENSNSALSTIGAISAMASLGFVTNSYISLTNGVAIIWDDAGWALQSYGKRSPPNGQEQRANELMIIYGATPQEINILKGSRTAYFADYVPGGSGGGTCFGRFLGGKEAYQGFFCGQTYRTLYSGGWQVTLWHSVVSPEHVPSLAKLQTGSPEYITLLQKIKKQESEWGAISDSEADKLMEQVTTILSKSAILAGPGSGDVQIQPDGYAEHQARIGETAARGDEIFVGYNSWALLAFQDNSLLGLNSNTQIQFSKLPRALLHLNINLGSVRPVVPVQGPRRPDVRIETPTATASVRGTDFTVKVNQDKSTDVFVNKGTVSLLNNQDQKEITITAGNKGSVNGANTLGPVQMAPTDSEIFAASNQVIIKFTNQSEQTLPNPANPFSSSSGSKNNSSSFIIPILVIIIIIVGIVIGVRIKRKRR